MMRFWFISSSVRTEIEWNSARGRSYWKSLSDFNVINVIHLEMINIFSYGSTIWTILNSQSINLCVVMNKALITRSIDLFPNYLWSLTINEFIKNQIQPKIANDSSCVQHSNRFIN